MSEQSVGPIDTNVFVHAHTTDHLSDECRKFLAALEQGQVSAILDHLVLHELSYVLMRIVRQLTRRQTADYMLTVINWPGIEGDKPLLTDTVARWAANPTLGFVDAYLAAFAFRRSSPVYTKNVREFAGQGVAVPDPLPDGSAP